MRRRALDVDFENAQFRRVDGVISRVDRSQRRHDALEQRTRIVETRRIDAVAEQSLSNCTKQQRLKRALIEEIVCICCVHATSDVRLQAMAS